MAKIKTRPWDPADHIVDGEDVLAYLKMVTPEEYDPAITPFFLDCIARSKGVAEIATCEFRQGRCPVGYRHHLNLPPLNDADSIRDAMPHTPEPITVNLRVC